MRFIVRGVDETDGLVIGKVLKEDTEVLKPGHVYDITFYDGEPIMRDLGETCIPKYINEVKEGQTNTVCWGNGIEAVLTWVDKLWLLTREEYKSYMEVRK